MIGILYNVHKKNLDYIMKKFSKQELDKLRSEHKKYNKEMRQLHCHFMQKSFDEYVAYRFGKPLPKKSKDVSPVQDPIYKKKEQHVPSMNSLGKMHSVTKVKQTNKYTGELITGIGVMHKSNLVPVINNDMAKDLATMRR